MMTELDQISNQNHLQLIKAMIPHLPAGRQKTISMLVKIIELQNVQNFYRPDSRNLHACGTPEQEAQDPLDILADIRNYCEENERELIDQILQAVSMMELYSILQEGGEN
ncbi:MAG: hypothetical protein LUI07_04905 [Lachnospiraceae bacterium]|nr:hypothetical protein [Lachnospiraceae bacterium]